MVLALYLPLTVLSTLVQYHHLGLRQYVITNCTTEHHTDVDNETIREKIKPTIENPKAKTY